MNNHTLGCMMRRAEQDARDEVYVDYLRRLQNVSTHVLMLAVYDEGLDVEARNMILGELHRRAVEVVELWNL